MKRVYMFFSAMNSREKVLKQEPTKTAKPNAKTLHSAFKKARRGKKPICVPKRDKKRK